MAVYHQYSALVPAANYLFVSAPGTGKALQVESVFCRNLTASTCKITLRDDNGPVWGEYIIENSEGRKPTVVGATLAENNALRIDFAGETGGDSILLSVGVTTLDVTP